MKTALVLGAGGFIGSHLVKRLKQEGYWVRGVDLKYPEFSKTEADEFIIGDLRDIRVVERAVAFMGERGNYYKSVPSRYWKPFDEIYQLAADMGGAGYIFSGDHDADVMHNSAVINLNVAKSCLKYKPGKLFFSSSACIYPQENQIDPNNPNCEESTAYPAHPDSEYGWEKIFSERMYLSFARNYNLDVRIARFHNIFGPEGSWNNGKEKAPAAMCRKVAQIEHDGTIEIWGDGQQTRSFLYIDECLEGVRRLMEHPGAIPPVNIGSDEMITIDNLAYLVAEWGGKKINITHIDGPLGVRGRCSDNRMIKQYLGWEPNYSLSEGIKHTYTWILKQLYDNK